MQERSVFEPPLNRFFLMPEAGPLTVRTRAPPYQYLRPRSHACLMC